MTRQRRPAQQEDLTGNVAGQPAGCREASWTTRRASAAIVAGCSKRPVPGSSKPRMARRRFGWCNRASPLRSGAHRPPHAGHQRARGGRGAIGLQTGPPRPGYFGGSRQRAGEGAAWVRSELTVGTPRRRPRRRRPAPEGEAIPAPPLSGSISISGLMAWLPCTEYESDR
jgi:hypothetical protein